MEWVFKSALRPISQERDMMFFYKRPGGPDGRSGRVRIISPPPGFDPGPSKPVACRYTDYAIPPHVITNVGYYKARNQSSITTPDFMKICQIIQELNAGDSQMTSNLTKWTERKRTVEIRQPERTIPSPSPFKRRAK